MAAKTPATVLRESFGSKIVLKASFADIDKSDTWASGLGEQIWGFFFQRTDAPGTTGTSGASIAVANSSGTFTFYTDEDNTTGDLYVFING